MLLESLIPDAQFRKPEGILGLFMARVLDSVNARENDWVIDLLAIKPTDSVLEIGFGSGRSIKKVAALTHKGHVAGIDFSDVMLRKARKLNAGAIKSGLVEIGFGEAESLPHVDASFDKVFAVYVMYFWADPVRVLREIKRVLKPGGTVAILLSSKTAAAKNVLLQNKLFRMYDEAELLDMFSMVGFINISFKHKLIGKEDKICVLANT